MTPFGWVSGAAAAGCGALRVQVVGPSTNSTVFHYFSGVLEESCGSTRVELFLPPIQAPTLLVTAGGTPWWNFCSSAAGRQALDVLCPIGSVLERMGDILLLGCWNGKKQRLSTSLVLVCHWVLMLFDVIWCHLMSFDVIWCCLFLFLLQPRKL